MELPIFKYHPNPIETGAIKKSDDVCDCCEQKKGYVYNSTVFTEDKITTICPWCIADGHAAKKFKAEFISGYFFFEDAEIDEAIITELSEQTPGYNSWQEGIWQHHCNDACEFHGDASKEDLQTLTGRTLEKFLEKEMVEEEQWTNILTNYEKGGNPAIYKFKCRHCPSVIYTMDFM